MHLRPVPQSASAVQMLRRLPPRDQLLRRDAVALNFGGAGGAARAHTASLRRTRASRWHSAEIIYGKAVADAVPRWGAGAKPSARPPEQTVRRRRAWPRAQRAPS